MTTDDWKRRALEAEARVDRLEAEAVRSQHKLTLLVAYIASAAEDLLDVASWALERETPAAAAGPEERPAPAPPESTERI